MAAADERDPSSGSGSCHTILRQCLGVDLESRRSTPRSAARGQQRRFRQSVTWEEGLAPETAGAESRGEPLQGLRADRLGAVERHLPVREVKTLTLLLGDPMHA